VRHVDGPVQKERAVPVVVDEALALLEHQFPEVFAVAEDLTSVAPEVVPVGALPVEEMGVVVDAAAHVSEGIVVALAVGHGLGRIAEVPLADVARDVAGLLHHLGDRHLLGGHSGVTGLRGDVARHARPLRIATRHQCCPRRRADRRPHVKLREPRPFPRQPIQAGSDQVFGPVAVHVNTALVVGEDQNDVGPAPSRLPESYRRKCRCARCHGQHPQEFTSALFVAHRYAPYLSPGDAYIILKTGRDATGHPAATLVVAAQCRRGNPPWLPFPGRDKSKWKEQK